MHSAKNTTPKSVIIEMYASSPFLAINLSPSICWGFGSFKGIWIWLFLYVFNLKPPGR